VKSITCLLFFSFAISSAQAQSTSAHASSKPLVVTIKDAQGQSVGTATLVADPKGVKLTFDIKNLPPGQHSVHIHQLAKCDPPDFKSAGPHFEPSGEAHTHEGMAAGDIPDFALFVDHDGKAQVTTIAPNVTLGTDDHSVLSNGGTSIIIHAVSTTTGSGAPPRIACGMITKPQ